MPETYKSDYGICNYGPDRRHACLRDSVDRGSLAAAARKLGCSAASVTRGVALLEGRLGMRLLHRNARALHLAQFGETYLATCREVLTALDLAERGAAAELERSSGLFTVTAPVLLGQLHVRPVLDGFLDANSEVQARLLLLDRVASLVEVGIDVAVRVAHLSDSTLVAAKIGEVRRVLVAAGKLLVVLQQYGPPAIPVHLVLPPGRENSEATPVRRIRRTKASSRN